MSGKILKPESKKPKKKVAGYVWDFEQMIFNKKSNSFALARIVQIMAQHMTNDTRKIPCKDDSSTAPRFLVRVYEEYEKRWGIVRRRIKKYLTEKEWENIENLDFIVLIAGISPKYADAMLFMYREVYQSPTEKEKVVKSLYLILLLIKNSIESSTFISGYTDFSNILPFSSISKKLSNPNEAS